MKKHSVGTAFDSGIDTDIIFGTVSSVSPLAVTVDSTFTIDSSHLTVPKYLSGESFSTTFNGTTGTMKTSNRLTVGTNVCMIRAMGGQKYAVIGIID